MSTSAQSAQNWLENKKPSINEVETMLKKLEQRIENWDGDEDTIQGSIDAALTLQAFLDRDGQPAPPSEPATSAKGLDTDALIPDQQPIALEESVKHETFAALKAQLGKNLTK